MGTFQPTRRPNPRPDLLRDVMRPTTTTNTIDFVNARVDALARQDIKITELDGVRLTNVTIVSGVITDPDEEGEVIGGGGGGGGAHSDLTGIIATDHHSNANDHSNALDHSNSLDHAQVHATAHEPSGGDTMAVDAAVGVGSLRTLGVGALQAAVGDHAHAGSGASVSFVVFMSGPG